jgi:PAS domain S-box-containing protein
VRVNQQTERLFGYQREQLERQSIEYLMPERFRGVHRRHVVNYFNNPRTRPMGVGIELAGECADGSEIPVEVQLSPVDIAGHILVIAAIRDMTERREG